MIDIKDAWYRVSVKALIFNEQGDILLCKEEKKGVWDLPGGGLDHGEESHDCLKREIKEEMGLEVLNIEGKPMCFITATKDLSKTRPWIGNLCYKVEVENLEYTPSDECTEIGFFNLETIKKIDTLPNVQFIFKEVL